MSAETLEWLNVMTLIGDTDTAESSWRRDGRAWHYRATLQGDEPNHYPGAIPVEDVRRRLFSWQPRAVRPMVAEYTDLTEDGVETVRIADENRQMIVRPKGALSPEDPGAILGVFKGGYKVHDYDEWLIRNVESILDDTLHIGSAGLLRNGAQAWVGITVPGVDHHARGRRVPALPVLGHLARRLRCHRLRPHGGDADLRQLALQLDGREGAEDQVQAHLQLAESHRRGARGAGHRLPPGHGRRVHGRGRAADQHHRLRRPVERVQGRDLPADRREGQRPGPGARAPTRSTGRPSWSSSTATTTGARPGPAPRSACSRPSTRTPTTSTWSRACRARCATWTAS
jgi:hypothetical protein